MTNPAKIADKVSAASGYQAGLHRRIHSFLPQPVGHPQRSETGARTQPIGYGTLRQHSSQQFRLSGPVPCAWCWCSQSWHSQHLARPGINFIAQRPQRLRATRFKPRRRTMDMSDRRPVVAVTPRYIGRTRMPRYVQRLACSAARPPLAGAYSNQRLDRHLEVIARDGKLCESESALDGSGNEIFPRPINAIGVIRPGSVQPNTRARSEPSSKRIRGPITTRF
jgi:hypothetical protein